ncbi:hypothetical protein GGR51DRAFT_572056 [Nemania sp. FL0031]|nr:hypothetical protein GGR51DRAFT_572056 [Nemania sp. FL0031]
MRQERFASYKLPDDFKAVNSQLFYHLASYTSITSRVRIVWRLEKTDVLLWPLIGYQICEYPHCVTATALRGTYSIYFQRSIWILERPEHGPIREGKKGEVEDSEAAWVERNVPIWAEQYVVCNLEKSSLCLICKHRQTLEQAQQFIIHLFKSFTAVAAGTEDLADLVHVLPRRWICAHQTEDGACGICFHTFKQCQPYSACGRSECRQLICKGCLQKWYGINRPGHVINAAALCCPFCRRQPTARVVPRLAGGISSLGNSCSAVQEAKSWIYAWCASCSTAKRFTERACGRGLLPRTRHWWCEECRVQDEDIRCCPGCRVPTERMAGYSHIMCGVPGCDTHWCFICGTAVDPAQIYMHMIQEHESWYDDDEFDDDDEDEDEDEERPLTLDEEQRSFRHRDTHN